MHRGVDFIRAGYAVARTSVVKAEAEEVSCIISVNTLEELF